jgi:uncharacterized protein YvpB
MDFLDFISNTVKLIPGFDLRIFITIILVSIIVGLDLSLLIRKVFKTSRITLLNCLFVALTLGLLLAHFLFLVIDLESMSITIAIATSLTITLNIARILIRPRLAFRLKPKVKIFINVLFIILNVLFLLSASTIAYVTLSTRPFAYKSVPEIWGNMTTAEQTIEIEFDIPIKPSDLQMNISPNVDGSWVFEKPVLNSGLFRKVNFIPNESFPAETKVVIYITGLKQVLPGGDTHEQSVEFFSSKTPKIVKTIPQNDSKNNGITGPIVLELDNRDGEFLIWDITITPNVEFSLNRDQSKKVKINLNSELLQDTDYKLDINLTNRTYDVKTKGTLSKGDSQKIYELKFKTVTTPLLKSYTPQGQNVKVDEVISLVFDENMQRESVENAFKITPEVAGKFEWENEQTIKFIPDNLLLKDTEYSIDFEKGLINAYGGMTKDPINVKFKTIGKVQIYEVSPFAGQNGLDPNTTNITIRFNQEVDRQSVQDHFWMNPGVAGTFTWDGNSLNYNIAGQIGYSTNYTFGITKGVKTIHGIDSDQDYTYSFATKDNIFILNVPQYYQPYGSFICNVVAAKMALSYYGIYRDEYGIVNSIGYGSNPDANFVNNYGTHWDPIANYISSQGRTAVAIRGMTVAQLTNEVQQGRPVIIWWYNGVSTPPMQTLYLGGGIGYRGMHSEVVTGYIGNPNNPTTIITNDPWLGPSWYNTNEFITNWSNFGYTGVVVY